MKEAITKPLHYTKYGVNPSIAAGNINDENGNPTGGDVVLSVPTKQEGVFHPVLQIEWQNGPRKHEYDDGVQAGGGLLPPNGAFVEDVLWAALQRLQFFNEGKFRSRQNSIAITKIEEALWALQDRTNERQFRGVEGSHEV